MKRCDFCGEHRALTLGPTREPWTQSARICAACVWRCTEMLVDHHFAADRRWVASETASTELDRSAL